MPTFAEHACLALLVEGISHGWAIGSLLAPDGELGRVYTLSRPLTYRAVDGLVAQGLVTRTETAGAKGRDRSLLKPTAAGRRACAGWLDEPVTHIRDVRVELLLKLELRRRRGLPNDTLLVAQHDVLCTALHALTTAATGDDLVDLWRREHARAVRRFLRGALEPRGPVAVPGHGTHRPDLRISARNQLRVTVDGVTTGEVMATVRGSLPDGQHLTAAITRDAVDDLDIAPGDAVVMIVKSTEIMVAKP